MLIILKEGQRPEDVERLLVLLDRLGWTGTPVRLGGADAIEASHPRDPTDLDDVERLPGVEAVLDVTGRARRAASGRAGSGSRPVRVGGLTIGDGRVVIGAGPCAVEDEGDLVRLAVQLRDAGAELLRGGAVKPRTSPYSFQGLGAGGYRALGRAGAASSLPVVSEVVDEETLEWATDHVDLIQVGARNMQNFHLLKRLARCGKPVLLKRGLAATLDEWLLSAEYLLDGGNPDVVLCERGIRTFSRHSRFTLDLSVVPALRELTDLPVLVDPSHATGRAGRVPSMARAAIAAGADGVLVEVHVRPEIARCDGRQALLPERFATLVGELRRVEEALASATEAVP